MALIRISRTARPMKYRSDSSKPASSANRRTDSSAPSTDSTTESSVEEKAGRELKITPVLGTGGECRNRITPGWVQAQNLIGPGHLENGADPGGDSRQAQL